MNIDNTQLIDLLQKCNADPQANLQDAITLLVHAVFLCPCQVTAGGNASLQLAQSVDGEDWMLAFADKAAFDAYLQQAEDIQAMQMRFADYCDVLSQHDSLHGFVINPDTENFAVSKALAQDIWTYEQTEQETSVAADGMTAHEENDSFMFEDEHDTMPAGDSIVDRNAEDAFSVELENKAALETEDTSALETEDSPNPAVENPFMLEEEGDSFIFEAEHDTVPTGDSIVDRNAENAFSVELENKAALETEDTCALETEDSPNPADENPFMLEEEGDSFMVDADTVPAVERAVDQNVENAIPVEIENKAALETEDTSALGTEDSPNPADENPFTLEEEGDSFIFEAEHDTVPAGERAVDQNAENAFSIELENKAALETEDTCALGTEDSPTPADESLQMFETEDNVVLETQEDAVSAVENEAVLNAVSNSVFFEDDDFNDDDDMPGDSLITALQNYFKTVPIVRSAYILSISVGEDPENDVPDYLLLLDCGDDGFESLESNIAAAFEPFLADGERYELGRAQAFPEIETREPFYRAGIPY